MAELDPQRLSFKYRLVQDGLLDADESPEDYPQEWCFSVSATVYHRFDDDGRERRVGRGRVYVVPDATDIDLFEVLDAHSQELADVAAMLLTDRPDLLAALAAGTRHDLMYVADLELHREFRGQGLGRSILRALLEAVGRGVGLVILQAAPQLSGELDDDGDAGMGIGRTGRVATGETGIDGAVARRRAKRSLARYWQAAGFERAAGDYYARLV
ncbi:GNAT family N-acetyltransferase [Sinomonas susongensis]|uniref:GNAT family N-acetyltransferase n=1 Tax=Sinomonas susongensis TaxID=1324851 RepID=UPI001109F063|nr:GNAT family N-acetyltransferase [Sinomonas susongensis]